MDNISHATDNHAKLLAIASSFAKFVDNTDKTVANTHTAARFATPAAPLPAAPTPTRARPRSQS
ncbi:MAG: hypothetical protein FWD98_03635 [Defluviitaleaceae bacterium]|nr:hypothetical protein [Defluviitaleaceae bacterium]